MRDIQNEADVKILVDEFYAAARKNEMLAPIFNDYIGDHWDEHLDRMYLFWNTMILGTKEFKGSAFTVHLKMPLNKEHFVVWNEIFEQTVDRLFSGTYAGYAKYYANCMSKNFPHRLENCKEPK